MKNEDSWLINWDLSDWCERTHRNTKTTTLTHDRGWNSWMLLMVIHGKMLMGLRRSWWGLWELTDGDSWEVTDGTHNGTHGKLMMGHHGTLLTMTHTGKWREAGDRDRQTDRENGHIDRQIDSQTDRSTDRERKTGQDTEQPVEPAPFFQGIIICVTKPSSHHFHHDFSWIGGNEQIITDSHEYESRFQS